MENQSIGDLLFCFLREVLFRNLCLLTVLLFVQYLQYLYLKSALFGNSRITDALTKTINDPDELLKRSIYLEDFRRWMRDSGWESFRYAQKRRIVIQPLRR